MSADHDWVGDFIYSSPRVSPELHAADASSAPPAELWMIWCGPGVEEDGDPDPGHWVGAFEPRGESWTDERSVFFSRKAAEEVIRGLGAEPRNVIPVKVR